MTIPFYLDLGCSFLLYVVEHTSCYEKRIIHSEDQKIIDAQKEEHRLKWQTRILFFRTTFGLITNIATFIAVCVVNKKTFVDIPAALGLFIFIVMFTALTYISTELVIWLIRNELYNIDDVLRSMIIYRIYEIEFDILMLYFSLVLSDWEMNQFTKATTVLALADIGVNIIILAKNVYDVENKNKMCCTILKTICFPPFQPLYTLYLQYAQNNRR